MQKSLEGVVTGAIDHSEQWGMVWFGLIFWGSVLNAIGADLLPSLAVEARGLSAFGIGLGLGLVAKLRGHWL